MELAVYLGIFFLAIIGCPLFIIMSLFTLSAFTFAEIDTSAISISIYQIAAQPMLLSIPLFTFAGFLLAESNSPKRMLRLTSSMFGWLPGGVAIVSLVVCAFFTAFTGASGVTIIALGGLLYPILKDEQYSEDFSLGIITTSGSLGLLFPPSLPIILYGLVGKVDIDKIFKAGIVPGILLIVILSLYSIKSGAGRIKQRVPFNFKEMISAIKSCFWELLLPFGVLGGIYGGYTTASEAAALTAAYCLVIECFIYKEINLFKDVPKIIQKSLSLVGAILLILSCALGLTDYLVDEEVPMKLLEFIRQFIDSKGMFLICLNIFLLIVGMMMDIFSAIVVVVPLIIPIALEYGVDPIHLAIIFLTNLEIGYITPPVGINLFISSFRFNRPVTELYKATFPFMVLLIIALMIITYVPSLSLFWFQ